MKRIALTILMANILISCTKEYIEHPTCRRYIEVSDKWDGEMNYLRTDTLYPNGKYSNYACGNELAKLQSYVPRIEGCLTGYQRFRYIIK